MSVAMSATEKSGTPIPGFSHSCALHNPQGQCRAAVLFHQRAYRSWSPRIAEDARLAGTEVLQPDTPKDVVLSTPWRGPRGLAALASAASINAILSTGYYVDLNESAAQHYLVDPLGGAAETLTPEQQKLVLGGESAMWSEFTPPTRIIDESRISSSCEAGGNRRTALVGAGYPPRCGFHVRPDGGGIRQAQAFLWPAASVLHLAEWLQRMSVAGGPDGPCGPLPASSSHRWDISGSR